MLDFDGRCNRPDVARNVATGASFGRSTAEAVSRLRSQRAGPPARHSGGVWICRADFFSGGAPSEVSAASHFLHMGVVGLAPWQPLGCMRCPAFSVSKFAFGTPPRERWATSRSNFCAMEMLAAPALPATFFTWAWLVSLHGSLQDACVAQLLACLNLRFELPQESAGRPCAAFVAPWKC